MTEQTPPFDLVTPIERPDAHERNRAECRDKLTRRIPPPSLHDHEASARNYQPSADLLMSINIAIHVAAPLLLTGEPGTGKTQVANFLGWYFDIPVVKYQVKSVASAEDLRYDYDAVGYLHWAQAQRETVQGTAGNSSDDKTRGELPADPVLARTATERSRFLSRGPLWQAYDEPGDAVLLIDEIDKAPRDFPNDLLHELDQHSFKHPFLGHEIKPRSGKPPIVIITSNDERRLPDAFLRRCIFHRIELTEDLVRDAVEAHVGSFPNLSTEARSLAMELFWKLHGVAQEKKPSTAELLVWLCILSAREVSLDTLRNARNAPLRELPGINALIKDRSDFDNLR